jgi:hypothetical protein
VVILIKICHSKISRLSTNQTAQSDDGDINSAVVDRNLLARQLLPVDGEEANSHDEETS